MFFKNFPTVSYDFGDVIINLPNIVSSFRIKEDFLDNEELYLSYTIKDGETPEMIADRIYDSPESVWMILNVNQIIDIHSQWPMSYATLERFVDKKYGYGKRNTIHHYRNTRGVIVSEDHPLYERIAVTVIEHENDLNDAKRKILVLKPEYASALQSALWKTLN